MTILKTTINPLTESEWEELVALKQAINDDPASVHYEKMEKFTELMVRSLQERGG
jgi:two-component SAPR family response regulator